MSTQVVSVGFTVTAPGGSVPTGTVTVTDGVDSCVGTVAAGACQVTFTSLGARSLTATYSGDGSHVGSTSAATEHHVLAATTTVITTDTPDPSVKAQAVAVGFTVTATGGSTPTGTVTVTDGVDSCTAAAASGSCQVTLTTPGPRTLVATYGGDDSFAGSSSAGVSHLVQVTTTTTITGDTPDPSLAGEIVTVAFQVSASNGVPTGSVTVTDGVDTCTGSVATGSCQGTFTTIGDRTLVASYAGDGTALGSTSAGSPHRVDPAVPPTIAVDLTSLSFGAVVNGGTGLAGALTAVTSEQRVTITQQGGGTVDWAVTASQPWIQVGPSAGSGSGSFSVGVVGDPSLPTAGTATGTVTITSVDALHGAGSRASPPIVIAVTLRTMAPATSGVPFGAIDTPADGVTGVQGSIGLTGWALDDIEVAGLRIFRDPVPPEAAGALVFVGSATFLNGARPDVTVLHSELPHARRAGWGLLILTNLLPGQGNGTFTLRVFADDAEGHTVAPGTRTITADNASATTPFGAIDTPGQGETVGAQIPSSASASGELVNFGWALTPLPKAIPIDGSTIVVFIDGVPIGTVDYNHFRADIAALFPGLANSGGAVGFKIIDTTGLANGLHTIAWAVTDSDGAAAGIGSRFFSVLNAGGPSASSVVDGPSSGWATTGPALPSDTLGVRRGYALRSAPRAIRAVDGPFHVLGFELERLELTLGGPGRSYRGGLLVDGALGPLPIGSTLDASTGIFTWHPGVGFVGSYDLVFSRQGASDRRDIPVRIHLRPRLGDDRSPRLAIDRPVGSHVTRPFTVEGWAIDRAASDGPGVDAVHVWAYGVEDQEAIFLGVADYGATRPDVGAVYGGQFEASAYGLSVFDLPPGTYDLVVYTHSSVAGSFNNSGQVRVAVR